MIDWRTVSFQLIPTKHKPQEDVERTLDDLQDQM